MKHVHILITDDANSEQTLLPIVTLAAPQQGASDMYERIRNILLSTGMPANLRGYHYLNVGIQLAVSNPALLGRLTSELYPAIAAQFGVTASKVERAIRHAIDITWQRGRVEQVNSLFGCRAACQEDKPTTGQLIATIAEQIWQEQNKNDRRAPRVGDPEGTL